LKKSLTTAIAFISLVTCLLGCGGAQQGGAEKSSTDTEAPDVSSSEEEADWTSAPPPDNGLPPLEVREKSIVVKGTLVEGQVHPRLQQRLGDIKACLEEELPGPFPHAYDFTLTFEISAAGKASSLQLETPVDDIKACVNHFMAVINDITFEPSSETGKPTTVIYALDVTRGMYF
jgi:hypothetical protein